MTVENSNPGKGIVRPFPDEYYENGRINWPKLRAYILTFPRREIQPQVLWRYHRLRIRFLKRQEEELRKKSKEESSGETTSNWCDES